MSTEKKWQASYARWAGQIVGKLNKATLWLAGICAAFFFVIVIALFLSLIDGFTASQFNLRDFEQTKKWALGQYLILLRVAREGNRPRLVEAIKEVEENLKAYMGKSVCWQIPVAGVTEDSVFLQGSWSEQGPEFQPTGTATYMAIGCEEEPDVSAIGSMLTTPIGVPPGPKGIPCHLTKVHIGRHISKSEAVKLKSGDYVTLQATIEKTTVLFGSTIGIRLEGITVSAK